MFLIGCHSHIVNVNGDGKRLTKTVISYMVLSENNHKKRGGRSVKTIKEYMRLPYRMEIVPDTDEGGFIVSFPELPGCISCGDTVDKAVENANDAKRAWIEAAIEDGITINEPDRIEDYSGQFVLRIPKSLHKTLSDNSKREGVSMNQYCMYLLSKNSAV